jgi:hypothetical protein
MEYPVVRATNQMAQSKVLELISKGILEVVPAPPQRRVRLRMEYDLRTDQAAKSLDCIQSNDYTAFVSKGLRLIHVMRWGHPGVMIRLPGLNLKNCSRRKICEIVLNLLYEV